MGAEKYGAHAFLNVDTLEEAMAEVVDLANYAHMTYVKLVFLQDLVRRVAAATEKPDKQGFIPMKEFMS